MPPVNRQRADERDHDSNGVERGIQNPSSRFQTYSAENRFLRIDHPDNWRVYSSGSGTGIGVTMAPAGGIVNANGRQEIIEGFILNHYAPFQADSRRSFRDPNSPDRLRDATEDLVHQLLRGNAYLEIDERSWQRGSIDGRPADKVILYGISPVTSDYERVTLYTRTLLDGHILYMVFISPEARHGLLEQTFNRMLSSLQIHEDRGYGH